MMNVLDALRYRLTPPGSTGLEGEPQGQRTLMMLGPERQLPPGLPLVVQDSILKRPSYQEGGQYAPRDFGGEQYLPGDDPRNREYRLNDLLGFSEYMRRNSQLPWPEDSFATPLQPGQSPYATPEGPSPGMDYLPGGATRISARLPSALNQPSYAEGMVIPGPRNPLMEQERAARLAPQRENDLDANVRYMDYLKRSGMWAMPEGAYGMRLGHEQQPAQPPFASPLNQLMIHPGSRVPAALY